MPSRTYSGIDLINYIVGDNITEIPTGIASGNHAINEFSQANLIATFTGVATDNNPNGSFISIGGDITIDGDFDFDAFPAIPDLAVINAIRLQVNYSANLQAIANGTDVMSASVFAQVATQSPDIAFTWSDLTLSLSDSASSAGNNMAQAAGAITFSTFEEVTFSPGIDKTQLAAQYSAIRIWLAGINLQAGNTTNPAVDCDASITSTITIENFEFIVSYSDGNNDITLDPPGGDVESGQFLTVSSANLDVQELTYAALQGDNVIPLVPKKNPDGTVELEVPTPATVPCFDCFTGCPDCENCLGVCENDLDCDACQACMAECLSCLVECLESDELAEACFESTAEPPDTEVPIRIICASPGNQFEGSVELGTFTILIANASGIYKLVPGKGHDTLYSAIRDGSTYNVKIPNPFGKTGFFRS